MVFNVPVRWGRVLNGVMAGAGLLALAGCGRGAEYQYLEVPDGQTFAKVPAGWTIDSAGWTDFVFVDEGAINSAFVPGDNPIAWRAVVNDTTDGKLPTGVVSVQSVDVRNRSNLLIGPMIDPVEGTEEVSRVKVRLGDLEGWRARHEGEDRRRELGGRPDDPHRRPSLHHLLPPVRLHRDVSRPLLRRRSRKCSPRSGSSHEVPQTSRRRAGQTVKAPSRSRSPVGRPRRSSLHRSTSRDLPPRERDQTTRRPLAMWDRSKYLLLLAGLFVFFWWQKIDDNPIKSVSDAHWETVEKQVWVWALLGFELVRQFHFLVAERWAGYGSGSGGSSAASRDGRSARPVDPLPPRPRAALAVHPHRRVGDRRPARRRVAGRRDGQPARSAQRRAADGGASSSTRSSRSRSSSRSSGSCRAAASRRTFPDDIETRFDDVWGQDPVKERIRENLIFLENPEAIESRGGYTPGGILLYGRPAPVRRCWPKPPPARPASRSCSSTPARSSTCSWASASSR
ncbi:MAG: hypothetical protein R2713_23850 [Ilumatobacteraceae bacterium]